jgi:hypothetical protein
MIFGNEDFRKAHDRSDVDTDRQALHHTLGKGPNQASAGNHNHPAYEVPNSFLYAQRIAAQNINNNVVVEILWDTETKDTDGMLDLAVNNEIVTKRAGFYIAFAKITYAANVTGVRQVFIKRNGANVSNWQINANVTGTLSIYFPDPIRLDVGDIATLATLQNSGGVLAASLCSLTLLRVADL